MEYLAAVHNSLAIQNHIRHHHAILVIEVNDPSTF